MAGVTPQSIPPDVRAVLRQVFTEAAAALERGDVATARALVGTGRTVARNKLPPGEPRGELLEGCGRVEGVLAGAGNDDDRRALAAAYCRRLQRTVRDHGGPDAGTGE